MLSYQNLEIFNILQTVVVVVVIILNIRIHNKLIDENEELKERIKRDREWAEDYRYLSIESAIASERLRVSHEEFKKTCEEFQERVNEVK